MIYSEVKNGKSEARRQVEKTGLRFIAISICYNGVTLWGPEGLEKFALRVHRMRRRCKVWCPRALPKGCSEDP